MNGYVRGKCASEQQLLNELAKLLVVKDVASRRMLVVLRSLTFFYASAPHGSPIPQTLLSSLCTLLPQLKDKKESVLLKDGHQRIARIALCLLARLIDKFETQKMRLTLMQGMDKSLDSAEHVLMSFLLTLDTAVVTPSGLLLPRQRATLRLYAQLCRIFGNREQLVKYIMTLLQQSRVLAEHSVDGKQKRVAFRSPMHYGAVVGACHAIRFYTQPEEQVSAVKELTQLAFTIPAGTASRHAAKTLLSLFSSSSMSENKMFSVAIATKAIEVYLLKTQPRTLLGGDSLTSVYLLRLCGELRQLPVHQQQQQPKVPNISGDSSLMLETARRSPDSDIRKSNALLAQLQGYLLDIVQDGAVANPAVAPAVLLVAIEETLREASLSASFEKMSSCDAKCIFEQVVDALFSLLPLDKPSQTCNSGLLHRVCRAVQFVAEHFDTAILQLDISSAQSIMNPPYLNQLAVRIHMLTDHSNAFVTCEAFRALVWLLPRCTSGAGRNSNSIDGWENLFWHLEALPFNRIQPTRRAAIAWTLFRRCVTTLKSVGSAVDPPLLLGCLRIVLAWFRAQPCSWHSGMLTAIWQTALRECILPLGDAVFSSINEVLDFQCAPTGAAASESLVVKQSALQFLSHKEGGMKYAVRHSSLSNALLTRLTKQALLETYTLQRLSIRAIMRLLDEARLQANSSILLHVDATLKFLQQIQQTNEGKSRKSGFILCGKKNTSNSGCGATDDDPFSDKAIGDEASKNNCGAPFDLTSSNPKFTSQAYEPSTVPNFAGNCFDAGACNDAEDTQVFYTSPFANWDNSSVTEKNRVDYGLKSSGDPANFSSSNWGQIFNFDFSFNGESNGENNGFVTMSKASVASATFEVADRANGFLTPIAAVNTTASELSSRAGSFTNEVQRTTTLRMPEETLFATRFCSVPADSGPFADFSKPVVDTPAETPLFGVITESEQSAFFDNEVDCKFEAPQAADDPTASEVTTFSRTDSFTAMVHDRSTTDSRRYEAGITVVESRADFNLNGYERQKADVTFKDEFDLMFDDVSVAESEHNFDRDKFDGDFNDIFGDFKN